jgi:penicillin V acylase-like amidase (Ntn superfamily)
MHVYKSMIVRSALAAAFLLSILLVLCVPIRACTVFFAFDGKLALAGQNEDWDDTNTQLWVVPRTSTTYGVLYFVLDAATIPKVAYESAHDSEI